MASTSIFQSLQGQTYNRVADQVVEAGIAYATACLKKNGTIYWTSNLTPKTTCTGSISSGTEYVEQNDTYSSTFTVAPPSSSGSQAPSAVVTGTVTLANGKQYVAKGTVIVELASTASMVTALPSSPADGMEVYLSVNSPVNGAILWHLRYSSSNGKWNFLGGPPLVLKNGTFGSQYSISSPGSSSVNLIYSFTAPRPGSYKINYSSTVYWSSTGANMTVALGPCPSTSSFAPPSYTYVAGTDTYGPPLSGSVITNLATANYYLCYTQWGARNGLSLTGMYMELLPITLNP